MLKSQELFTCFCIVASTYWYVLSVRPQRTVSTLATYYEYVRDVFSTFSLPSP